MSFRRHRFYRLIFLFLAGMLFLEGLAFGQRRTGDRVEPVERLQGEEIGRFLDQFRGRGLAGDYSFVFELRTMPRRGQERLLYGRMWGGQREAGAVTLLEFAGEEGADDGVRYLMHGGSEPAVWRADKGEDGEYGIEEVGVEDWLEPIMGTEYTPFDLTMPFIYWEDYDYEGVVRTRSRPCHRFLMHPPERFREAFPEIGSVRVDLEAEFIAMLGVEVLASQGRPARRFAVIDFKKVQDRWIPGTIDLTDLATRDKTRFQVSAAAMHLVLSPSIFEPEQLNRDMPATLWDEFDRVN